MAFQKEVWSADIQETIFSGVFGFIRESVNHDLFVDYKTVHVPQGGTVGSVEKNRSVLPATVAQRTDTDLEYSLANYTTDPIVITNLEEIQSTYDKRASVMAQHVKGINQRIAVETLYNWAADTATDIVITTGAATSGIGATGTTGTRDGMLLVDVAKAAALLDDEDIPAEGRFMVIPSKMYWDFVNIEKANLLSSDFNKTITDNEMAMGIVRKVYGFNIIVRSSTVNYAAGTATRNAVGAATAASDEAGAVCWQKDYVANAMGSIKSYFKQDDPTFFGDVLSAEVNHGSAKMRTDKKGIVTIVQDS